MTSGLHPTTTARCLDVVKPLGVAGELGSYAGGQMRPEYLNALEWARWNHWFIAMWLVPVVIIFFASRSWKFAVVALPIAIVACFIFFFLGVEFYWEVKSLIAETDAEWEDVTSDTGRLFGPILIGPPFAVVYCSVLALIINPAVWIYLRIARRSSVAKSLGKSSAKPVVTPDDGNAG